MDKSMSLNRIIFIEREKKIVSRSRNEKFIITNINRLRIYSPFEKIIPF